MAPAQPELPERFERANEIFSDSLDLPDAERDSFVRGQCGDDASMFDTVARMLATYRGLGKFMREPAVRSPSAGMNEIRPGDTLGGRFQVLVPVGQGGMGEVYRVLDQLSGETVALKTLRPQLVGDHSFEERFRQELTLARKISHTNVCRIHEMFAEQRQDRRLLYFTMECLEGETLAARIARGPLGHEETMRIARQIAAGLDAAHAAGILHRDLKPGNVIVESTGGRAVITDFGLAKTLQSIASGSGETNTGQIAGTLNYMPPEQFLGEALTPAADVFAFGLIVFEMATGRRPFQREDVGSAIRRSQPALPRQWDATIDRALASDPALRYTSAGDMIGDLEKAAVPGSRILKLPRRKLLIGGGVAAISLSAIPIVSRLREWGVTQPASPLMMLTPLTHSSDPTTARTLDLLLANQLTQSAHVRLLPDEQVASSWQRIRGSKEAPPAKFEPGTARDIAMRSGAHYVLFGNLGDAGDEQVLRLNLELMGGDPGHARKSWPKDFTVQRKEDLPSAVFEGSSWVRKVVGESAANLEARSRRPEEMTTGSWQALVEFEKANDAWQAHDPNAAILHLRTALDIDPRFALAAGRLGDLLTATGRVDEGLSTHRTAADLVREKNLTDRESLRIRGLFLLDTGQNAEAERVFSRWALEYPNDGVAMFYEADAVEFQGRPDEALSLGKKAVDLNPKNAVFIAGNADRLLRFRKFADAEREAVRLAAIDPNDWTDILLSALAFRRADLPEVWRHLLRLGQTGSHEFQSRSFALRACLRAEQGLYADAEQLYRDGLAFDSTAGTGAQPQLSKRRQLAQLYLRQGRRDEAASLCREIAAAKQGHEATMEAGCILAQAGEIRQAREAIIPDLPDWPVYQHWDLRLQGEIALAAGRPVDALKLFRQVPPLRNEDIWPDFTARAAIAAGEMEEARGYVAALFANPGRYWRVAEFIGPGFFRWAAGLTQTLGLARPRLQEVLSRTATTF